MMFETEKATDANDLPHAARVAPGPGGCCDCGRTVSHPLHRTTTVEQASHREPLVETEKGS